ncbi:MAG: hypothetical protein V7731_13435 [Amphritea sp.]
MVYLRTYGSGFRQNERKTLREPVNLAELADRIHQPEVRLAVLKYTYHPPVYLWDFGIRASSYLSVGDTVYIQSEHTLYYTKIHEIISDERGEIGDLVNWHRIQKHPWEHPVILKPCVHLDGLAGAVAFLENKISVEGNFFKLPT